MKLPGATMPQVHLQPGEVLVTQEPQWVLTLLGSCVSVTMFNARFHLAAICHALLPEPRGETPPGPGRAQGFRYLTIALPAMTERFARLGLKPGEVEVKLFGGGNVVMMGGNSHDDQSIGSANVAMARRLLKAARYHIKAQSVGGNRGCKIMFNTLTGEVLHKWLSRGVVTI
jgi:chemotaxis protein CheD